MKFRTLTTNPDQVLYLAIIVLLHFRLLSYFVWYSTNYCKNSIKFLVSMFRCKFMNLIDSFISYYLNIRRWARSFYRLIIGKGEAPGQLPHQKKVRASCLIILAQSSDWSIKQTNILYYKCQQTKLKSSSKIDQPPVLSSSC